MRAVHHGAVTSFEDEKGYGEVTGDDGVTRFFHCTAIADGTRTITVGTPVTFVVAAGHRGRWEAAAVTPR